MEETWGGSFVAVKTITDIPNQRVYVFPAGKETDIVPVRKTDTLSAATFSFFIPMQKLNLKLRKDRQIVVVPTAVPVKDRAVAYCFALAGVRATKRPRVPEVDGGAPAQPKSTDAANPATVAKPAAETKPTAETISVDAPTATDVTKPAPEAKKAEGSPKSPKGAPAAAGTQSTAKV
jgi:hypothetical protein